MTSGSPYEVHVFRGALNVDGRRVIVHVDHEQRRIIVSVHPQDSESERIAALVEAIQTQVMNGSPGGPLLGPVRVVTARRSDR